VVDARVHAHPEFSQRGAIIASERAAPTEGIEHVRNVVKAQFAALHFQFRVALLETLEQDAGRHVAGVQIREEVVACLQDELVEQVRDFIGEGQLVVGFAGHMLLNQAIE